MFPPKSPRQNARSPANSRRRTKPNIVNSQHINPTKVRQLRPTQPLPAWLRSLSTIQRVTGILLGAVLGLSIIVHTYTVHTQDLWKQQHGQLQRLQTQERQQGVMDENLKHQLAEAAEKPESKLIAPTPKQLVFIPSAPLRSTKPTPTSEPNKPEDQARLGY